MDSIELMTNRANPGIDPIFHIWGWQIPVYLFLGGLVAGIMIIASAQEWKFAEKWEPRLSRIIPILAMVLLSLGMFALYLDLEIKGLKLNIIRLYMTFRPTSPISWGSWILVITYPSLALWFLSSISPEGMNRFAAKFRFLRFLVLVRDWASRIKGKILVANIIMGTALGIYTGIFLSGMVARPVWHSGILGPLFLTSGISAGAALLTFFKVSHDLSRAFIKWDVVALIAELGFLALFLLDNMTGTALHKAAAGLFLSGPYSGAFFGIVVLAGILAPLGMEWADLTKRVKAPIIVPMLVLIGSLALRFVIVSAGQALGYNLY
ncbi:MAG: NrfD/PsrC family molybdoenzyme membrane anchor subunit [Desulfomonilia bacterium]